MPKKSALKCYFRCTVDGPLHRFPKWEYPHLEKFESWKAVLSLKTQGYSNQYIYNNVRFCYRHFEKYFQLPSHQLTRNAVPTMYLSLPESLQVQAMPTVKVTSPSHFSIEYQQEILNNSAQEQAYSSTAITHPTSNSDILLNVSKRDLKNRGMSGASLLTSYKHKSRGVVRKIDLLKKTITKLRHKCKSHAQEIRMAGKISKSKVFLEVLEQFPEPIIFFTNMQLKHLKKPRGRKYSLKEKILSLTILKQSPKGFNLLRKFYGSTIQKNFTKTFKLHHFKARY